MTKPLSDPDQPVKPEKAPEEAVNAVRSDFPTVEEAGGRDPWQAELTGHDGASCLDRRDIDPVADLDGEEDQL